MDKNGLIGPLQLGTLRALRSCCFDEGFCVCKKAIPLLSHCSQPLVSFTLPPKHPSFTPSPSPQSFIHSHKLPSFTPSPSPQSSIHSPKLPSFTLSAGLPSQNKIASKHGASAMLVELQGPNGGQASSNRRHLRSGRGRPHLGHMGQVNLLRSPLSAYQCGLFPRCFCSTGCANS